MALKLFRFFIKLMATLADLQKEFFDDTITYYSLNPEKRRCVNEMGVCYYDPIKAHKFSSKGCAIGRHVSPKLRSQLPMARVTDDRVFYQLPANLQRLGKDFLSAVQAFHDDGIYWDEKGLSVDGENAVKAMRERFNLT